jgi:hypothetical protein
MSIDIMNFLQLDNYINENYNNMTAEEYQQFVEQLEKYKDAILGE